MHSLAVWLEATRPKTLTAAVVPIAAGTALARGLGHPLQWRMAVFSLLSALFIQIGTNFINDSIDFRKGADTESRIGPRRVTQSGLMSAETVLLAGLACFGLSAICAVPLLIQGGWLILGIGILSLACGYAYTGGPFPLAYLGLGELFVLLFFGILAVSGVFFLQTGKIIEWRSLLCGTQIGLLATVLIAINNLRDREGDRESRKRTLAVRLGVGFGRAEIAFLCVTPFLLGLAWIPAGLFWAGVLPWLTLPLALRIAHQVARTEPSPAYNRFLAQSAGLHLVFGFLLGAGCLLSHAG